MSVKLAVVSLWAEDVHQTAHFYRDVIGLPLLPHHQTRPHFDLGSSTLVIMSGHPTPPENPQPERFPLLAFAVDDLDVSLEVLRRHAVDLPWGVEHNPQARWIMFYDPAGNLVELVQFA